MTDASPAPPEASASLQAAEQRFEQRRNALRGADPDREQLACYHLALEAAELAAARALARFAADQPEGAIARALAVIACGEAAGEPPPTDVYDSVAVRLLDGAPLPRGLDEEHRILRETFRKFADENVAPIAERIHRQDELVPESLIGELAELGCFGLSIPERYGGFQDDEAPDNLGMVLVTEELSRGSLGAAGSLITRPEILAKALLKGGTEEQRERLLPPIASGERMVAVCVTEPDHGSDVAGLQCSATPTDGGWLLSGVKTWATFAGRAEWLMVLARTEPDPALRHKGLSILVVEKPAFRGHEFAFTQPEGGRIEGRAIPTIGYRGMHSFEVAFDRYFVPANNLVGGEAGRGRGFYLQMAGFAGGRLQTAARANGLMEAALEQALRYCRERKVFGRLLGEQPLSRYKLARMAALLTGARRLSYDVARLFDRGEGAMEASLVKLQASRAAEWVCREAMQLHGGMGYAEEYAVSRYFVDARVLPIFEGAEEVLALKVIARTLLREPGERAGAHAGRRTP
ncbi:MAG: acyl-CoA dehydrogenase [Planctomycetota bacterium]|nr:MAG: acyl-CoA dehydrogenase [Planctomycetota bacterium]